MPRRISLRDRLPSTPPTPQGREAIYAGTHPDEDGRRPEATSDGSSPRRLIRRWEEAHKRVTFYCSIELLDALEAEMRRSDRTKTQVIVDALSDHLTPPSRASRSQRRPPPPE